MSQTNNTLLNWIESNGMAKRKDDISILLQSMDIEEVSDMQHCEEQDFIDAIKKSQTKFSNIILNKLNKAINQFRKQHQMSDINITSVNNDMVCVNMYPFYPQNIPTLTF